MIEHSLSILWQTTFAASLLIAALLILRRVFKGKVPPTWPYAVWILVLIRLLIPVNIPSPASVMNIIKPPPVVKVDTRTIDFPAPDLFVEPQPNSGQQSGTVTQNATAPNPGSPIEKPDAYEILFILWVGGALAVLAYMAVLNMLFLRRLRKSSEELAFDQIPFYRDLCRQVGIKTPLPVIISHKLSSPCLGGLFRPYIAITPEVAADNTILKHVLLHELCHFKQKDNFFSLLRNICCTIYWFNPLVWIAAFTSRDDSELSCDDRVLRYLDEKEGIEYGQTLLTLFSNCNRKAAVLNTATAMASGKSNIKERIDMIINRPRILKTVSALAVVSVVFLGAMTLTGAKEEPAFGQPNVKSTAQVVDDKASDLSDKATVTAGMGETSTKRLLDMESLRMLAKGELTLKDIMSGYKADRVIQDESYNYTAWQYTLDNGFSFELKYIQEKNLPDRYTASLSNNKSNYIFFPARPESLERFLDASAKGNRYYLKTYASFNGQKIAEIEYDETKQRSESLKVLDHGRTFTMSQAGSFGRVCWSPDSVYAAVINMTSLNGMAGGDSSAYLYDSRDHRFEGIVNPKTIISAFNKSGTFNKEVTAVNLHPRIQWSPDSKKLLLSFYPAVNDSNVVARMVYNVSEDKVEDIVMSDISQFP